MSDALDSILDWLRDGARDVSRPQDVEVEIGEAVLAFVETDEYRQSPLQHVWTTGTPLRQRLEKEPLELKGFREPVAVYGMR